MDETGYCLSDRVSAIRHLHTNGGGLLLGEVDQRIGLLNRLAGCFTDYRHPHASEHSVAERVYGLALGDEARHEHEWTTITSIARTVPSLILLRLINWLAGRRRFWKIVKER